jgi:DNA-binding transcriptional LysR family regulator
VDLIVGRGSFPIPEDDLNAEVLFEEPLLVVAGIQSSWARRRKLELAELVDAKWIQFPLNENPGVMVEQAFRAQGLAVPRPIVRASSFFLRNMLLTSGEYLTVVPACMLRVFNDKVPTVKPLPVDLGVQARPVAIFTLKNRTLSPVADLLINCVRFVAGALAPQARHRR